MKELTVDEIINGMKKIILNAQSLTEEAEILYEKKYYSRAYTLSHIAREEISKIYMLYRAGIEIISGKKIDHKKLEKRIRDHKSKIQFFTVPISSLFNAIGLNSPYIKNINIRKNDSLYVGYKDNVFQSPSEHITKHIAKRTIYLSKKNIVRINSIYDPIVTLEYWNKASKEEFNAIFEKVLNITTYEELSKYIDIEKLMEFIHNSHKTT